MKPRNLYILITFVITWWALSGCSADRAASRPSQNTTPEAISSAVLEAETLFKQREDLEKLRTSIKLLSAVRDPDNRNYQVEWIYAKHNYFLGKFSTDEKESEEALEEGRDAGKIASRIEPQKPDGYFW